MKIISTTADHGSAAEKAHIEKRHDARTADLRLIERRRKPRQTRTQFFDHVRDYCERKYGKA